MMNHAVKYSLALLGSGALCASAESKAEQPENVSPPEQEAGTGSPPAPALRSISFIGAGTEKSDAEKRKIYAATVRTEDRKLRREPREIPGIAISKPRPDSPEAGDIVLTISQVPSGPDRQSIPPALLATSKASGRDGAEKASYSITTAADPEKAGEFTVTISPKTDDGETRSKETSAVVASEDAPGHDEAEKASYSITTTADSEKAGEITVTISQKNGDEETTGRETQSAIADPEKKVGPAPQPKNDGKAHGQAVAEKDDRAVIQIALLLDTSGSMQGLINQARTYLWKVVNDMTLARQNGKLPAIQIALYEYGSGRLSSKDAWVRQVLPFTDDLDKVSDELFKLKTGGSEEYCGAVMDRALKELKWNTENPDALKLIFIAGNEPFNQGNVPYAPVIARGLERGITVNTIYCGSAGDGDSVLWKDGARKGDGSFLNIDHNAAPPEPETPYDAELATLNVSLNGTYLAYGSQEVRAEKLERQARQDKLTEAASPAAAAGRIAAKANKAAYRNTSWDLVDLYEEQGSRAVEELGNTGILPEELKGKSAKEVEAVVKEKAEERARLQKKIADVGRQRDTWLNKWKAEQSASGGGKANTLDDAIIQAVRRQAGKKKFSFVEENVPYENSPMNKEQ